MKMILKWIEKLFLPKISDGVISDELSGSEFEYSAIASINVESLKDINDVEMLEFNQGKYTLTSEACTIVNNLRSLMKTASGYYGYKPTNQDEFDAVEFAITQGYKVGKGWLVSYGADAARNWWNGKHPEMAMTSTIINETNPDFYKLLDKGYSLTGSYSGSTEYNNDFRSDAVLNGKTFGPRTYGHCTNWEKGAVCNDSYFGNLYNIYKILFPSDVVSNIVWSNNFFLYTPKNDNSAEIKRLTQFKKETNDAITANSNAWNLTGDEVYKKRLNTTNNKLREKVKQIDIELGKL